MKIILINSILLLSLSAFSQALIQSSVELRDWEDNSFNECLAEQVNAAIPPATKLHAFLEYSRNNQTSAIKIIQARYLLKNENSGGLKVVYVPLETPQVWIPTTPDNFHLGYKAESIVAHTSLRDLNTDEQISPIDLTTCISKNEAVNNFTYDFGLKTIRSSSYKNFTIKNTTQNPLNFKYITSVGSEYRARHDCKQELQPNESCRIEVEFRPKFEGYSRAAFEVNFAEIDTIIIEVRGQARR